MNPRELLSAQRVQNTENIQKAFGMDIEKAERDFMYDLSVKMMDSFVKGELIGIDGNIIKSRDEAFKYAIDLIKGDSKRKAKISKVMREFGSGTLKSSSGETVTSKDQAIAIAMSEAGMKKSDDEDEDGETKNKLKGKEDDDEEDDADDKVKKTNKLKGGEGDKSSVASLAKKYKVDEDVVEDAIEAGMEVESEHTDDESVAREIAMDHVSEDLKYYTKLKKVEKSDDADEDDKPGKKEMEDEDEDDDPDDNKDPKDKKKKGKKKESDDGVGAQGYEDAEKNADGTPDTENDEEAEEDKEKAELSLTDALQKGKDLSKLTKIQKQVTRGGKTFMRTIYVEQHKGREE